MSSSSFSGLPSRTTLCIIFPTISPFGLDGNHDGVWLPQQIGTMSLSQIFDIFNFSSFKHHVTLPLWHQGQRADQNQHTLPLFSSCRRSVLQIWCIMKWPSSPWVHAEYSNIFFNEVHDSMTFLSPMTHTYIKDSSKWIYIEESSTQPSGFTNVTQLPNQVGLQTWLSYPTKWVYKLTSPYMTEYYNFTTWVSTRPFHQNINMTIYDQHQEDLKRDHIT